MKNSGEEMLKSKLKKLEKKILTFPELLEVSGGVCMDNILLAESESELCFPVSYRWFLMTFGMGSFGDLEIFGLSETEDRKLKRENALPNMMFALKQLRQNSGLPKEYLPFCGDGVGRYYCIKTAFSEYEDGEVCILNMETKHMELLPYSITFTDFLSKQVEDIVERRVRE